MRASRREIMLSAIATLGASALCPRAADAEPGPDERDLTQRDYRAQTQTESSVEGQPPAPLPIVVHDLSAADEQAVKDAHGVKLVKGKQWKHETPDQRDAHLRQLRANLPRGTVLVITIPKGDVWLIPPEDKPGGVQDDQNQIYEHLRVHNVLREWTEAERTALPVSVGNGPTSADLTARTDNRLPPIVAFTKPRF